MLRAMAWGWAWGLAGAAMLSAQAGWTGPESGFLYDAPTGTVRPVQGAWGSAWLGTPVLQNVGQAWVAPTGWSAVVCHGELCSVVADLSAPRLEVLTQLPGMPEGAAWSSDSQTVALWSASGHWVRVWKDLAGVPTLAAQVNVAEATPVVAAAVSGEGGVVVLALGGEPGGLYELTTAGGLAPLAGLRAAALSFGEGALYALEVGTGKLARVELPGGWTTLWDLPLADPSALAFGIDQHHRPVIYVSGRADQTLAAVDPATGEIRETVSLPVEAAQAAPLAGSYLLSSREQGGLVWSYTPGRGAFFLPAPTVDESASRAPRRR